MTKQELREYVGPVRYQPFADVVPERGIYSGLTPAGWAHVRFEGKNEPEEVEPWCLTKAGGRRWHGKLNTSTDASSARRGTAKATA